MAVPVWRRLAAASCLVLGIGGAAYMKLHFGPAAMDSLARLGKPLPSLVVDAAGTAADLKELVAGRRSVIVFYSPTCQVCRETLPALQPFPVTLQLIMVSESSAEVDPEARRFPQASLFFDRWNVLKRSFAIAALPTILFVDERGVLRDGMVGSYRREWVQRKLTEFASRID
jgi:thiol-disulfide isomerase/thioredoxin